MRLRKQRGIALITAIWVLAVLLILVGGFAAMVQSQTAIARNLGQLTQARWAARSGIRRAEVELTNIVALPYTALDGTKMVLTSEDDTSSDSSDERGSVSYRTVIEDEAGKININTAPAAVLNVFFPTEVTDAIIDWRDTDSTPEPEGAEDDYYVGLTPAYHCKNGPFTTVRELLLVKGVTRDMLSTVVTDDGQTLQDILTVSSWDTNTDANGQPRVNIATASQDELSQAFSDMLTTQEIEAIIAQRTSSAFTHPADILRVPNLAREKVAQIYDRLTTTTTQRRTGLVNINTAPLEVLTALQGMDESTAQAIVDYRDTQGPFNDVGQLLAVDQVSTNVFAQVADQVTTRSKVFRVTSTGMYEDDGVSQTITCLLQAESSSSTTTMRTLYWQE